MKIPSVRKEAGVYCVFCGFLMAIWWVVWFATGQAGTEVVTAPVQLLFLLVAEAQTAIALIVGGIGLLLERSWSFRLYLVASGMLLYTVVNTVGVFAQRGSTAVAGLFVIFSALAAMFLYLTTRSTKGRGVHE